MPSAWAELKGSRAMPPTPIERSEPAPAGGLRPRPTDRSIDWRSWYDGHTVSADEAVSHIQPDDFIWIPVGQRVAGLLASLLGHLDELAPVHAAFVPTDDVSWYTPEIAEQLRLSMVYSAPMSRRAVNEGRVDFRPWWVWGAHKAADEHRPGARSPDVVPITVRPPNEHGYCRLGNWVWDAKDTAMCARTVIAIVNDGLPRTFGDTWIHVSDIDWFVPDSEPLPRTRWVPPDPEPWDKPIAEYVRSLIRDGDTLQIGTGSTTGNLARLGALEDKHDLGWFSELTVPGIIDLVEAGVITGRHMATHPGKILNTTAGSTPEEIAYIDDNPMFEFYSTEYMHHPICIARNDNFVAINGAISVDLTGQIAASHIGPQLYSGTGGQLAYALGAFMSKGGRSITVLPSTARGGSVSRITPQFVAGQIVTLPRDIADIVVTEYGIAHLLNKTQRERAEQLIAVAHPDFRTELRRDAARLLSL
jgi:4-hydroxybutyrate CoA-transferase